MDGLEQLVAQRQNVLAFCSDLEGHVIMTKQRSHHRNTTELAGNSALRVFGVCEEAGDAMQTV